MNQLLKKFIRKIKVTYDIWSATDISKTIKIAPDNEARAFIESVLRPKLTVSTAQQGLALKMMVDEILAGMKNPQEHFINGRLEQLLDGVAAQAVWFHSQLAALTTVWELRVRFFGIKLGVQPNVPIDSKKKQHRSNKSIEHKLLSDTIKEINKKTGNRLNLKLLELCELRNSIVHCNPQGMRAYALPLLGKDILKRIRGNVIALKFDSNSITNLSDLKEEPEIESQDTFSWFLEIFNSELPTKAFDLFERSIKSLNLLQEFAAVSFDERKTTFNNLLFHGTRPDENEISKYKEYFKSSRSSGDRDTDEFFKELLSSFRDLK